MSRTAGNGGNDGLERNVGRVLQIGIRASSVCLGAGLVASLLGVPPRFTHPLLTAGLFLLLATPVSRVVVSAVTYLRARDWVFVAVTLIILAELALSVIAAMHAGTL